MSIKVTLEWYEWQNAALISIMSHCDALRFGRNNSYDEMEGSDGMPPILNHFRFAGAELAVAKTLDHYWPALIGKPREGFPDVFPNLEIRWTAREDGGLIVRKTDHDERPYILVRGLGPDYDIIGWMYGRDAKQPKWWQGHWERPAYLVPEEELCQDFTQRKRALTGEVR